MFPIPYPAKARFSSELRRRVSIRLIFGSGPVQQQRPCASSSRPYLQLVDQVKAAAASGALHAGSPLPGIRPLAEELRVNRNTVAKAYSALESQGVIETIAGKGCFVRANHSPFKKEVRRKLLAETLDGAVIQAHHLQIDKADFLRVAEERFDALEHKRHAANS